MLLLKPTLVLESEEYVTQILPLTLIFFTATDLIRARPKNFETKAILASFSEVFGLDSREEKRKESKYK